MSSLFSKKSKQAPLRRDVARSRQREAEKNSDTTDRYSFRRSHTLTGSASSEVRTPVERSAQLRSPRVKSHELTRTRRHVMGLFSACILIAMGLFFVIYEFSANVMITINDNASIQPAAPYESTIQSYLGANPLERLRWFVDTKNLTTALQQKHPEVAAVEFDGRAGFGVSHVQIETRKPVAEWTVNGTKLYVDSRGIAFEKNYFPSPDVTIVDHSGIRVNGNRMLVSNSFIGFVGQVVGAADQLEHIRVTKITLPPHTTRQVAVSVAGVKYDIKMTTDRAAGEQVEDMARALRWLRKHDVHPRSIDVRVAGQAFYK